MLQTSETANKLNLIDYIMCLMAAWVISQSILGGMVFWFLIGYMFFINYAVWRKENGR